MPASYPSSLFTATTINNGDTSDASQINNPVAEIIAIETGLLNGVQHVFKPLTDNTYDLGTSSVAWRDLFVKRNLTHLGYAGVGAPLVSNASKQIIEQALTNGQLLIGSTGAAPVATTITAGTGVSVTNGAGTITIAGSSGIKSYTTTNANVVNTAAETDAVSCTIAANDMADGDYLKMTIAVLFNCDAAGSPSVTSKVYFGSGSTSFGSANIGNAGVERKWLLEIIAQRVGADVWVYVPIAAATSRLPVVAVTQDMESFTNVGVIAAPTFSNSNTFKLTIQLSNATANTYFKPQSSHVHRFF